MRFTRLMKTGTYNPKTHVRLAQAAKRFGFAKAYFSNKIAEGYRIPKYVDVNGMFFDKKDLDKLEETMSRRVDDYGNHKRGKLPRRAIRVTRSTTKAGGTNGTASNNGKLTVAITPATLSELIKSGTNIQLVLK